MTPATQELVEEHGGIMLMLKIMERMADRLGRGEAVNESHLWKMVEFLENFTDKCHHGKEEDILFPELAKNPTNVAAINELLGEHKTGRDFISGIAESLGGYQPGNPDAVHMAVNMKGYVILITGHIRKENDQLFQLADKELAEETQLSVKAQYDKFEADMIALGKDEEYQDWLNELKSVYLVD